MTFAEDNTPNYFLYSMTVLNGFFTNAGLPLCYEILAETSFPLSETISAGLIFGLYSCIRLILKGLNTLLDEDNTGI